MKKLFFIALFVSSTLFAQMHWEEDIEDAQEQGCRTNKVVMVMLSRVGCPACEYMKGVVFKDKNFTQKFNQNFIAVYVDVKEDFIPEGMTYFATPTFYFVGKDDKVLKKITGAKNAKEFADALNGLKRR